MRPQYTITLSPQDIARFWLSVNKDGPTQPHCLELGPCWPWRGKPNSAGYGRFQVGGRTGKLLLAHRVAYTIDGGAIPSGVLVLHRCDFRLCARFSHLFLGDHVANARDMVAKGRGCSGDEAIFRRYPELALRGADHPNAHLTAPQAAAIKVLLSSPGCPSQDVIAKQFGVSQGTITNIKRGLVWKEVVL